MAGITHRTVYAEFTKDSTNVRHLRFADWAVCLTALGAMVEPFQVGRNVLQFHTTDRPVLDFTDMIAMINSLEFANSDTLPRKISGGGQVLHGGNMIPRTGR